jgi:hypothetical protein
MATTRQSASARGWARLLLAGVGTAALVLLASRAESIGERIPFVFLALWAGSATMVGLVFSPVGPDLAGHAPQDAARRLLWARKLRLAAVSLLPFTLVPLLEVGRSGHDPALWLMDGALVITLCSVPYFTLLTRGVVGGVALSIALPSLLWVPASSALFAVIKRSQREGVGTAADPFAMHAFFAPEFRYLFYLLCATVLFVYCPVMLALGRRQFLRTPDAGPGPAPDPAGK